MENKNNKQVEEGRGLTKYDKKMQKRKEAELKAKKRKMAVRGTCIAVVAVCVILAGFLIISSVGQSVSYIKVGGESVSKNEFNFYYMRTLNNYGSMYAQYGQIDMSVPLDEQQYSENMTWEDYFEQLAKEDLIRVKALVKDAKKNDFKGDVDAAYEENAKVLAEDAKTNNMSEDDYYTEMFGDVKEDVEEYIKEYLLAELWYEEVSKQKAATDEQIETYYQANKASYDSVDYYVYAVTPEGIDIETCTEAEYNSAMIAAHNEATAVLASVEKKGTLEENKTQSDMTSATLSEWLYDDARTEGESAVVDDNDNSTIYAVKFVKRYRDENPTANIRAIVTDSADVDADAVLEEWKSGAKTEESFIELVKKYTADTSVTDGLYEGVTRVGMEVEGLTDWLFEEERAEGDTMAITADDGNKYVVYYKGENAPDYKFAIKEVLLEETMSSYVTSLMDAMEVKNPNNIGGTAETEQASE